MKIEIRESIVGKRVSCAECGETVGLFKEAAEMRTAIQHHVCCSITVTTEIDNWIIIKAVQRHNHLALTEIQARAVIIKLATALNDLAFAREQQEMRDTLDQPWDADEQAEADALPNDASERRL